MLADVPYQVVGASIVARPDLRDILYRVGSLFGTTLLLPAVLCTGRKKWFFWGLLIAVNVALYWFFDPARD